MDTTGTFRKEGREFEGGELGWINGDQEKITDKIMDKIVVLDGGR